MSTSLQNQNSYQNNKILFTGKYQPPFYFCSSISMSVGEFKTWRIPMSHSYFSLRQLCLASSRRSGTVCKWRRAKITRGEYNFVYSISSIHTSCSFCWCYLRKSVISDSWWQSLKSIIRFSNFFLFTKREKDTLIVCCFKVQIEGIKSIWKKKTQKKCAFRNMYVILICIVCEFENFLIYISVF